MLSVYVPRGTTLERMAVEPGSPLSDEAVWIDLVMPTVQEDKLVEKLLGIAVATREEMQEIEVSSRLFPATVLPPCVTTSLGHLRSLNTSWRGPVRPRCPGNRC